MKGKIFLAWQSQEKDVERFIKKQLRKSKKYLLQTKKLDIEIIIAPTQSESGSPDIMDKILNQISDSDVYIGDLSAISIHNSGVQISNPNVMYETGLALALLGENRSILLASSECKIDKLAFDINHKRISSIDISNDNFYKELSDWISFAMIEATNQRYVKQYLVKDILDEIIVLYNNLMRLIYGTEVLSYSLNFKDISVESITESLKNNIYDVFQIKTDYMEMISNIEKNISLFYSSGNHFLIYNTIRLIETLREYESIKQLNNYAHFKCLGIDNSCTYNFADYNSFRLESIENYGKLKNEIYFRKDIMILSKAIPILPHINIFKKSGISNALSECKTNIQHNMTVAYITKYKFLPDSSIEEFAIRIYNMLDYMNNILDYLKLDVTNINNVKGEDREIGLLHFKNC